MLKAIKSNKYVLSDEVTANIIKTIKEFLNADANNSLLDSEMYNDTIRAIMSYKIALLVIDNIKEVLIKQGFITVKYAGEISGMASIGWYEDKLVYSSFVE